MGDRVEFLGAIPRSEVLAWLRRTDEFVHPSLHDSGGWATIEAMAAAVTVICLDIGGPGTQVTPAVGRAVDAAPGAASTIKSLASAMRDLATAPAHRTSLGEAARRRVDALYTWSAKAALFSNAYATLVQESLDDCG